MAEGNKKLIRIREELTCSICKKLFAGPKTLSCLHTFCEGCLRTHIEQRSLDEELAGVQDVRERVPCPKPSCKHVEYLDRPDVSLVRTNSTYKNMVAHLLLEKRVRAGCDSSDSDGEVAKCDSCDEEGKAVAFCKTCNDRLCEICRESHRREKRYKAHSVKPLSSSGSNDDSQIVTHYPWHCTKHGDDVSKQLTEVVLYCKTCDEMICRECSLVEPHENHNKSEAKNVIGKAFYQPRIVEHEQKVKGLQGNFTNFIGEMKELKDRLKKHQEYVKKHIDERLNAIHKELEKEKGSLLTKVDQIFVSKNKRLEDQIKELEEIEATLKDSRKMVNDTLEVGIPPEILFLMTQFIDRMQKLFDRYDPHDRTPRENDIIQFNPNTEIDLSDALGTVTADPFPVAFTVEKLDAVHFIKGVKSSIIVTCRDIAGTPRPIKHDIKVELCPQPNGDTIMGQIEKDETKGIYRIELQPNVHGIHELAINVVVGKEEKRIPIKESPFIVKVARPVRSQIEVENKVIPGLENPWGVAVKYATKEEVDGGDGAGEGGVGGEDGGGGDGGEDGGGGDGGGGGGDENIDIIAISDVGTHRIAVVTNNDFQHPNWIGTAGEGDLQFKSPRGIAFNQDGHIAVVEKDNCRVQVVSVAGQFKSKFGKRGLENGEFERPTDIVINADGIMFVSDSNSNRIQYFKPNGEFIGVFGKSGPLNTPYALACDGLGQILVTEQNGKRVQCWKPIAPNTGCFDGSSSSESLQGSDEGFEIAFKSESLFDQPVGITYHPETDYIIVTEMTKHRLTILDKNGQLLFRKGEDKFTTPMSISVLGDSRAIVCDCGKKQLVIFKIVEDS